MTQYSNFKRRNQRNALWNGNFDAWAAGTSFTVSERTACMTVHGFSTTGALTASRSSASKPNDNCNYVHLVTTNTGQVSLGAANHSHVVVRVEGYDFVPFIGNSATLSFWVRASVTGIYSIGLRNSVSDRSYVTEYTINQSNTWERKVIHVVFDYSGGTWDYTTGIGIQISFTQACGSTYATSTTDEWVTGNYLASTNQANNIATNGNTFYISQCQLELGDVATDFDFLERTLIERLSARYYQSLYLSHRMGGQIGTGQGANYTGWKYPYPMRSAPTVTISGVNIWNPNQGWKAVTSSNLNSSYTARAMHVFYDSTYTGNQNNWGLLLYGSFFLDARL